MAIKEWTTHLPAGPDVKLTDQPDLVNLVDLERVSQLHAVRDIADYCAKKIGSDLLEVGSLRQLVGDLVTRVGTLEGQVTTLQGQIALAGVSQSVEMLNKVPSTGYNTNSASFVDVDGGSGQLGQTFVAPAAGTYLVLFSGVVWATVQWAHARYRLVIDAAGTPIYVGADDVTWSTLVPVSASGTVEYRLLLGTAVLTAGSHTIKPQWKRVDGGTSSLLQTDANNPFQARAIRIG